MAVWRDERWQGKASTKYTKSTADRDYDRVPAVCRKRSRWKTRDESHAAREAASADRHRALSCFLLPPPPTFICLFRSPVEARLASAMQMRNAAPLRVSMRFLRLDRFQPNVPTPEGLIKISETRPTLNLSLSIASRRASGCIILNRDPASAARYRCSDAFPARPCLVLPLPEGEGEDGEGPCVFFRRVTSATRMHNEAGRNKARRWLARVRAFIASSGSKRSAR